VSRRDPGPLRAEQPAAAREARRARRRRTLGRIGIALFFVAALASVVWRQTVGEDRFGELERLREEIAVARAEKAELESRILELSRRERIVRIARDRLGMHVARDDEIVLLPVPASGSESDTGTSDSMEKGRDTASGGEG
jgi:cell division protein FtsL